MLWLCIKLWAFLLVCLCMHAGACSSVRGLFWFIQRWLGWHYGFLQLLRNLQVNVLYMLQSSTLPSSVFNLACSLFATVNGCCSGNVSPRCYCELSGIEGFNRRVRPRLFLVLSCRLCHSTIFLLVPCMALSTQVLLSLVCVCHAFKPSPRVSPFSVGTCSVVLVYQNRNPLPGFVIQGLVCM